jgi:hypothetical protein
VEGKACRLQRLLDQPRRLDWGLRTTTIVVHCG